MSKDQLRRTLPATGEWWRLQPRCEHAQAVKPIGEQEGHGDKKCSRYGRNQSPRHVGRNAEHVLGSDEEWEQGRVNQLQPLFPHSKITTPVGKILLYACIIRPSLSIVVATTPAQRSRRTRTSTASPISTLNAPRASSVSSLTRNRIFPAFATPILSRSIKRHLPRRLVGSLRSARKTGTGEWPLKSDQRDSTLRQREAEPIQGESSPARDSVGRGSLEACRCSAARTALVLRGWESPCPKQHQ